MEIKDSIVNLKKGLRTTLTNVPALIDTLVRGLDGVEESLAPEDYSAERIVGKFGDDDLYEKIVNIGALPNATFQSYPHNIANINHIINVCGSAYNPTGTTIPIPYLYTDANIIMYADRTNISVKPDTDRSSFTGIIKLQYTKASANRTPENDTKNGDDVKTIDNPEELKK